jgi:hypothetical protein
MTGYAKEAFWRMGIWAALALLFVGLILWPGVPTRYLSSGWMRLLFGILGVGVVGGVGLMVDLASRRPRSPLE